MNSHEEGVARMNMFKDWSDALSEDRHRDMAAAVAHFKATHTQVGTRWIRTGNYIEIDRGSRKVRPPREGA